MRTYPSNIVMMQQSKFLMKYKAQGAEHSHAYGQALQRCSSQKLTCPSGLRHKWRATLSKTLAVVPAIARGFFLLSRHLWQQRIATILLG